MIFLLKYIRWLIFGSSVVVAIFAYVLVQSTFGGESLRTIRTEEVFALLAVTYLYFALLKSPLYLVFPTLPGKTLYHRARKALGLSAFLFAVLHASFAFFGLLGGFGGLGFLTGKYLLAISLSFSALVILTILAITSYKPFIRKLGTKWKIIHRFVYLAALLIIVHALMLGSHFANLSGFIPQVFFVALFFLLFLEAIRFDRYIRKKFSFAPTYSVAFVLCIAFLSILAFMIYAPSSVSQPFNIHAAHQQLAQQALKDSRNQQSQIPGLSGDKTKRFSVNYSVSQNPLPNQDITIKFSIFDATNGAPVSIFKTLYAKPMHMIIVDNSLTYFSHIHPTQVGSDFVITTQVPKENLYHIYITFQPFGAIEQQFAFPLQVGADKGQLSTKTIDTTFTKTFADYEVSIENLNNLSAKDMTLGNQKITFSLKNAKTGQLVNTLHPYLDSFGHLTLIKQDTYDFMHVHPFSLTIPKSTDTAGPTVDFLPIGIYGPIKPGIYRVFAEFNPDGTLITADFTIRINN